jgi:Holliday junction resolvasome RuvABC endonuclease subunit
VVDGGAEELRYERRPRTDDEDARDRELRVLAIDPHPRGFGYAVFEGPLRLVDWGTRDRPPGQGARSRYERIGELVRRYRPTVIVVEDCTVTGSHGATRESGGSPRAFSSAARASGVVGRALPLAAVYRAFAGTGAGTKYGIATALVRAFPELMVRLPPKRKPWQTEDSRMSIFDAVALGLTYFRRLRRTGNGRTPDAPSRNADRNA